MSKPSIGKSTKSSTFLLLGPLDTDNGTGGYSTVHTEVFMALGTAFIMALEFVFFSRVCVEICGESLHFRL